MTALGIIGIGLVVVAAIVFGPIITIWALNLLFGLTIPSTFATWFAVLWLGSFTTVASRGSNSNG